MSETFFTRVKARMRERWPDRYPKPNQPTQRQIAAIVGIKQASVAKWAAKGEPEMKNARAMALKLGVCIEWLLTGRGPKFPTEPFMGDGDTAALLSLWEDLEPEGRVRALELLRAALALTGSVGAATKAQAAAAVHEGRPAYTARKQ